MDEEAEEYPDDAAAELLRVVPAAGTPVLHPLYSTDDTEDGSYDAYVVIF